MSLDILSLSRFYHLKIDTLKNKLKKYIGNLSSILEYTSSDRWRLNDKKECRND